MKFKIGDICEVVKDVNGHEFEIGEHVRIVEVRPDDEDYPEDEDYKAEKLDGSDYWYVIDEELELVDRKGDETE